VWCAVSEYVSGERVLEHNQKAVGIKYPVCLPGNHKMTELELKRGYEVLPDNNVRFGIRIINNSDYAISDVKVILDYNESLFMLEGSEIQKLGTIPPAVPRTAKFVLKPLGCIHIKKRLQQPYVTKTICGSGTP